MGWPKGQPRKPKVAAEDPDDDDDEPMREFRMRSAPASTSTGTMHVPYKGGVREIHVTDGITELIPEDLEPALQAYGYRRI